MSTRKWSGTNGASQHAPRSAVDRPSPLWCATAPNTGSAPCPSTLRALPAPEGEETNQSKCTSDGTLTARSRSLEVEQEGYGRSSASGNAGGVHLCNLWSLFRRVLQLNNLAGDDVRNANPLSLHRLSRLHSLRSGVVFPTHPRMARPATLMIDRTNSLACWVEKSCFFAMH